MIPFNRPTFTGKERAYIDTILSNGQYSGNGTYNKKCDAWLEKNLNCKKVLVTTSCTHALEFSSILAEIEPGDEIILPSFTFTSTANAFALRGAKLIFVDVRPDTMNIDENKIEEAVTNRTKAIVVVHYAGVGCEMEKICYIARNHGLIVIEDAAQAILSMYKNKHLGTIGEIGTLSFHETKNIQSGEGGAILINDNRLVKRAEIVREKGTNRLQFLRGEVDKYTWVDLGSSYLPSELVAAFLYGQLEMAETVIADRIKSWNLYYEGLRSLSDDMLVELPNVPAGCMHNGHLFFIKLKDHNTRQKLIEHLKKDEIQAVFHYIPLHDSPFGKKAGIFYGEDKWTTRESRRLLRLPLWYGIKSTEIEQVIDSINRFYNKSNNP